MAPGTLAGYRAAVASIPLIAEFLTHLFQDKQLAPGRIPSCYSLILQGHRSPDVGHDLALTVLLVPFSREHPRRPKVLPQWDLSLVLMALTRAPFEPLQLAAPKFLAWKTFFLTLLPSGPEGVNST